MIGAHIAGVPVEETLAGLAPMGAAGFGVLVAYGRLRWRRPRRRRRRR
jgi:hypothetical protein